MVTLATSARLISKSGQPDPFELSTETGQDQLTQLGPLCGLGYSFPFLGHL
jgi:hypothetical protein